MSKRHHLLNLRVLAEPGANLSNTNASMSPRWSNSERTSKNRIMVEIIIRNNQLVTPETQIRLMQRGNFLELLE